MGKMFDFDFNYDEDLQRVENFDTLEAKVIFLKAQQMAYEEANEIITRTNDSIRYTENYPYLINALIEHLTTNKLQSDQLPQSATLPKDIEPTNSFKYNTPKQKNHLESILNKLKQTDGNIMFVNAAGKLTDFKKIFNEAPLNKIKPIDWKKSKASLRYFIKQFSFAMSNENLFKTTAYCFTNNGDKLTYSQISEAKQISTKDKKAIDNIFKLYPLIK